MRWGPGTIFFFDRARPEELQVLFAQRRRAGKKPLLIHKKEPALSSEVVQERGRRLEAQRIVRLHAPRLRIIRESRDGGLHLLFAEALVPKRAGQPPGLLFSQHHFATRRDVDLFQCLRGALVDGVELPYGGDSVEIQGQAHRKLLTRDKNVNDFTADRQLSVDADGGDPEVPSGSQPQGGLLGVQLLSFFHAHGMACEVAGSGHGSQERPKRGNNQELFAAGQPGKRGDPFAEQLVQEGLPLRNSWCPTTGRARRARRRKTPRPA